MKTFIWGVALVFTVLNPSLHAEVSPDILFEVNFSLAENAVTGPEGIKAIKSDEGYGVYVSGFFGNNLAKVPLRVEIEAASPDGCMVGARFLQYDKEKKKLASAGANLWNRSLGDNFQVLKADVVLEQENTDSVRLAIYRSNNEGTLFLKSVSVKQRPAVPTEGLVNKSESPDSLFEVNFSLAENAVTGPEGIKAIKSDEGYGVYVSGFFGNNLAKVPLRVEIEAASPDGCMVGARFLQYDKEKKKLESAGANLWNRSLGENFQIIRGDVVLEQENMDSVRLVIYRSNKEGTLFLKSVSVKQRPAVTTEDLVNELELKLKRQGYQTQREGDYLVAKKTDERSYYHRFSGDETMNSEDFIAKAYIGTTWIRDETRPTVFPIGPHIYGGLQQRAEILGMTEEQFAEHLAKDVKAHGGNTIYYANLTANPETFKTAVAAAVKHGVQVIGQLTANLYLRPEKGREHYDKVTVPAATTILPQYRGLEGVIAWMPKEEPYASVMDLLAEYRGKVRELDPTHAIYTLHNNIPAFEIDDTNLPEWFGFDRYRFKCHSAHYGILISTPKDMAARLRREIAEFYREAQKRGRPLIFVMQGYGHQNIHTTEDIKNWTNGAKDRLDPGAVSKK